VVDIDVLIPTYGRQLTLNNTLRMLLAQDCLPKKVIVVNQTTGVDRAEPDVLDAYREANLDLVWINLEFPNVMAAQNAAVLASTAEICLVLDDDIIPPPDLVRKHWQRHQDGQGWVAVGGQVWHRLPKVAVEALSLEQPARGTTPGVLHDTMIPGGPLFGGNFSIRRDVVLALGGWDESFVGSANWQEGDLIHRMQERAYPFVWDPGIWILHLRVPFGGCRIPGNKLFAEWTKTTNFFLYKYRYPAEKPWKEVLSTALRAGPLRREVVLSPWRWPCAWFGFLKGWQVGIVKARNPVLPIREVNAGKNASLLRGCH